MTNLTTYQKIALILFALCKVTNIMSIALIFAGLVDSSYLYTGKCMIAGSGIALILCLFILGLDYQKGQEKERTDKQLIKNLLADPNTRRLIKEGLKK